ncbi:GIY-YIG nuclease family protein [Ekhidna lutea]|uniref:hypothetical protein n=1 Tax=Ekhidna lutea TaxID=447679 RepID=UPI0034DAE150
MTNQHHTVFYTGVTSELIPRVYEHKTKLYPKASLQNTTLISWSILRDSIL